MKSIFLLLLSLFTYAHQSIGQKLLISVKVAQNRPSATFDNPPTKEDVEFRKKGVAIGIQSEYRLNKFFSLRPELFFENRGWYFPHKVLTPLGEIVDIGLVEVSYFYVTTPCLLQFGYGKIFRPFIYGGINPAFRVGGKFKTTYEGEDVFGFNEWLNPTAKKPILDFGFTHGIGVSTSIKRFFISLDIRRYRSRSKIGKTLHEKYIHHWGEMISLNLGYWIGTR